jgi:hypothetical protein
VQRYLGRPSRIPGPQSLGKKEICREGWDLGFIYPNETSPSGASLGEKKKLKFGLSFFQGYFFHPTMREGGIRKCSERGAIMDKFF